MTLLSYKTQKAVLEDLQTRHDLKRYVAARQRTIMALEYGHHIQTIAIILKTSQARFLTTKQYAELRRKEDERLEALALLRNDYSFEAIAERNQVGQHTVRRYYERHFQEQAELPMCSEQCRRAG